MEEKEAVKEAVNFASKHPKIARTIAITVGAVLTGGIVAAVYFVIKGVKKAKDF